MTDVDVLPAFEQWGRELPRLPFVHDFWGFVEAGRRLAEIHVHYEEQPEYPLQHVENPDLPLDYRVAKMRLSRWIFWMRRFGNCLDVIPETVFANGRLGGFFTRYARSE